MNASAMDHVQLNDANNIFYTNYTCIKSKKLQFCIYPYLTLANSYVTITSLELRQNMYYVLQQSTICSRLFEDFIAAATMFT